MCDIPKDPKELLPRIHMWQDLDWDWPARFGIKSKFWSNLKKETEIDVNFLALKVNLGAS